MTPNERRFGFVALVVFLAFAVVAGSCDDPERGLPRSTTTQSSVGDPAFEALPGADVEFGMRNSGAFRMEVPHQWNGDLVVYLGSAALVPLVPGLPPNRHSLIAQGFAWLSPSYDRQGLFLHDAARQAADLVQVFNDQIGDAANVYAIGESMGGGAALVLAEYAPSIVDGALPMCPSSGVADAHRRDVAPILAAAFAAGLDDEDLRSLGGEGVFAQLHQELSDESVYARFESLWLGLTGGPRPFGHEGLRNYLPPLLSRARSLIREGLVSNEHERYALDEPSAGLTDEFNDKVLRFDGDEAVANDEDVFGGHINVPVLTLTTTGDANVPIGASKTIAQRIEENNRGRFLVQRSVRDPDHCSFTSEEVDQAFKDLVRWVEEGTRPLGEDLLNGDSSSFGLAFTNPPRAGSPEADSQPHAKSRREITGTVRLDEDLYSGSSFGIAVIDEGLHVAACSYEASPVFGGRYWRTIASAEEAPPCGAPGRLVRGFVQVRGSELVLSDEVVEWSSLSTGSQEFSINSATSDRVWIVGGDVYSSDRGQSFRGATVEARSDGLLCARGTIPHLGPKSGYALLIPMSQSFASCIDVPALTFSVDGIPALPHPVGGTHVDLEVQ